MNLDLSNGLEALLSVWLCPTPNEPLFHSFANIPTELCNIELKFVAPFRVTTMRGEGTAVGDKPHARQTLPRVLLD
jgi:hypothetical protein